MTPREIWRGVLLAIGWLGSVLIAIGILELLGVL
mgnify:FL=1